MIEKLLNRFPSSKLQESPPESSGNYKWYHESNKKVYLGISLDEMTNDVEAVLDCLFEKWKMPQSRLKNNQTMIQQAWFDLLHFGHENEMLDLADQIRFTQIELLQSDVSSQDIEEACYGFFNESIQSVWVSDHTLVIIENENSSSFKIDDLVAFSKILEGDFYVKVKIYLGKFHFVSAWAEVKEIYAREQTLFEKARMDYRRESFFTFEKLAPLMMLGELPSSFVSVLKEEYQSVLEDKELLHTLQVYIENNMNASLTAKKMFMHRNSLLYRIDKFTEKTGLDIKQFEVAWVIYFLSLLEG